MTLFWIKQGNASSSHTTTPWTSALSSKSGVLTISPTFTKALSQRNRSFAQHYGVRRLNSSYIPNDIQICISTIQRMYSILKGEEIDESAEEESFFEQSGADTQAAKEVVYNSKYPPEFFDCIIVDECHRKVPFVSGLRQLTLRHSARPGVF